MMRPLLVDRCGRGRRGPARALRVAAFAAVAAVLGPAASAHGGLSMDEDMCKLRVGPYFMHFAGYQPSASGAREFCEDIPEIGQTVVTVDAVDDVLREIPIELRIVKDVGAGDSRAEIEANTVLHLAPKRYPAGSVSFEHRFDEPGKFVGYVMAGDKGQYIARFPFSVGRGEGPVRQYWPYAALVVVSVGLVAYTVRAQRRRDRHQPGGA